MDRPKLERVANVHDDEDGHHNYISIDNSHYKGNDSSQSGERENGTSASRQIDRLGDDPFAVTYYKGYESVGPLDGEKASVNEHIQYLPIQSHSNSPENTYQRFSHVNSFTQSQSEPLNFNKNRGMIPSNEKEHMLRMAHDPVNRNTNLEANILKNQEWRQLRQDTDRNDKETYRKTFAQEEGNEDDGIGGGACVHGAWSSGRPSYSFAHDEEAEEYLETIPDLARQLFKALDVSRDKKSFVDEVPIEQNQGDLHVRFNHMAELFQTEHINLERRICGLRRTIKESNVSLNSVSQSLKSSVASLMEISNIVTATGTVPGETLLEVIKFLASTSEEFELYRMVMSRSAKRLAMLDVHNRLDKMLNVMILYVRIISAECDHLKSNYVNLRTDFEQTIKLLEENEIPFGFPTTHVAVQNNNDNKEKQRLLDEEGLGNGQNDGCKVGDSEPEKILQFLLVPINSQSLTSSKEMFIVHEKSSSANFAARWLSEGYEVLRSELFWPWSQQQTIKVLQQCFSILLMMVALFVFLCGLLSSSVMFHP